MTLDEYRETLIARLRACQHTADARSLLAEASLFLTNSRINRMTQDRFWETLEEELDAVGEDAKFLGDPRAAAVLGAVVAAARARIARYRQRDDSDASPAGQNG
jgi:hypothetical protein